MIRPEYTNKRDLTYSNWHRTLSDKCLTTNIDFIEARKINGEIKIVAIIEEKDYRGNLREFQNEILIQLAKALNVSVYLVKHNACQFSNDKTKWNFEIIDLIKKERLYMNENNYRKFIENL